jgi:hypothetical protein
MAAFLSPVHYPKNIGKKGKEPPPSSAIPLTHRLGITQMRI